MTFSRPTVRYVDMAKYIDDNVPEGNYDESLTYEYIYHLVNMLAHKRRFYSDSDTYDYYAIYCANRIYMKITDKNTKRVKSILNYLKNILYYLKLDFEQEHFAQTLSREADDISHDNLRYKIEKTVDTIHIVEFEICLNDIVNTIKTFLKTIEYKQNDPIWRNIYISCLLSFLASVTLSNRDKDRLAHLEKVSINKDYLLEELLTDNESVILYHLDSSMFNYIKTLVCRIKHIIALDLCTTTSSYIPSVSNMKSLLLQSMSFGEDAWD